MKMIKKKLNEKYNNLGNELNELKKKDNNNAHSISELNKKKNMKHY